MKRKYYLLGVLLAFVAVGVYIGIALNHDKKPQAEPDEETESPVVQFKVQLMHYFVCDAVDTWRFDGKEENVFDVTEAECAEVEFINIHCATRFETLEDLKYLKNLKRLWMDPIPEPKDIDERRVKMEEHSAELVAELGEILPQLPKLEELYIGADMTVRDLSFLQDVKSLRDLSIIYGLENISGVGNMPDLETIRFFNGRIKDISPVLELKNLTKFIIVNNEVEDLSPLQSMTNLEWVIVRDNNISDITPLLSLNNPKVIKVMGNPVCEDADQMQMLREAFPDAEIDFFDKKTS